MNPHALFAKTFLTTIILLGVDGARLSGQPPTDPADATDPDNATDPADAADRQTAHQWTDGSRSIQYWRYLPPDYASGPDDSFPLVLFLHGGGESGSDLDRVKKHGPPKLIAAGRDFPAIVISPQNPGETKFWDDVMLISLLDEIEATHRVDRRRVYLTGMSRGGYGAWRLAIQNPNRFAALVPIAGGGPATYAFRLGKLPIWAFHGAKDPVIPASESQRMVDAVNARGGDARLSIDADAQHDSWTLAYENEALWDWLFEQRLALPGGDGN